MKNLLYTLLTALGLLATTSTAAWAEGNVQQLLNKFDRHPSYTSANAFFEELQREEFTDSPITFTSSTPRDTLLQQVWYWAAEYFYDQQDYPLAQKYGEQALPLCLGTGIAIHGDCLSLLSLIGVRQGDFDMAVRYAKACNEYDMQTGDADNISSSLNTLAGIYMSMRQPEEAEQYVLKGIEYAQKAGNEHRLAVLYGMASEVYHHLKKDHEALDYATRAYHIEVKADRKDKVAIRQAQRAAALISLHRTAEARKALEEAIPTLRENGNRHSLGIACIQMGLLLKQEKRNDEAVSYLNEALAIFHEQQDIYNECQASKSLYELLRESNPQLAMKHNDRYNELRDSLYDHETGELLQKYAAEYGYDELQQLRAEEHAAHRRGIAISLGILALLATGTYLLAHRNRRNYQRHVKELMARIEKQEKYPPNPPPPPPEGSGVDCNLPRTTPSCSNWWALSSRALRAATATWRPLPRR